MILDLLVRWHGLTQYFVVMENVLLAEKVNPLTGKKEPIVPHERYTE